jgi:endonuclease YncB( thermonuclease family)
VVGIVDGDTIWIVTGDRKRVKIRLASIDAPEKRQPFFDESKRHLGSLIFDRVIEVRTSKTDRWKRPIGQIFLDNSDVNIEMIKAGLAWHYKRFEKEQSLEDRERYSYAEEEARRNKLMIWSASDLVPPWEKRHPTQE